MWLAAKVITYNYKRSYQQIGLRSANEMTLTLQQRISALLKELSTGLFERENTLAIALLGAIAGQNTFLLGPPGTAKSLISRRLAEAFANPAYFEYLMNRFSTPEEVFGPVSLKALKEDKYVRQVDSYLPTADFAFLDEIWKSSPAILNTLLTIINEHIFKNGSERLKVPLKALIAASNETPPSNQGLDALYDRFVIRLTVPPLQNMDHFDQLLDAPPTSANTAITPELAITFEELAKWREQLHQVRLSKDTLLIIQLIRRAIAGDSSGHSIYVSDRRWQRAAILLKTSAFINGRTETNHSDAILLKHCLWTSAENRLLVEQIVMNAIQQMGSYTGTDLEELDARKETLELDIESRLYETKATYQTYTLSDGTECFLCETDWDGNLFTTLAEINHNLQTWGLPKPSSPASSGNNFLSFLIPINKRGTTRKFNPFDIHGNKLRHITACFDASGTCRLTRGTGAERQEYIFTPTPAIPQGKRKRVDAGVVASLRHEVLDVKNSYSALLTELTANLERYARQMNSPFTLEAEIKVALSGMQDQVDQLKHRVIDCERLEQLCQ